MDRVMAEARGHHIALVAVVKVDRRARSVHHLSTSLAELHRLGVGFAAIDQGLRIPPGTQDPTSELILNVLGAVAEWEGSIISERTKEGLAFVRARGTRLGRPPRKGIATLPPKRHPPMEGGSKTTV
jgi:DNA invertase Pin-like site-specific DNA recombinase